MTYFFLWTEWKFTHTFITGLVQIASSSFFFYSLSLSYNMRVELLNASLFYFPFHRWCKTLIYFYSFFSLFFLSLSLSFEWMSFEYLIPSANLLPPKKKLLVYNRWIIYTRYMLEFCTYIFTSFFISIVYTEIFKNERIFTYEYLQWWRKTVNSKVTIRYSNLV